MSSNIDELKINEDNMLSATESFWYSQGWNDGVEYLYSEGYIKLGENNALKTLGEIEELVNPTPLNEGMERDIVADIKRMAAHLGRAEAKNIIYLEEIKRKDIALQNRNIRIRQLVQIITDKNKLIRNFRLKIV